MSFVTEKDILNATRGGLDIIIDLYPDAYESADKPNRKFRIRDEKTPSAKLVRYKDGNYGVIDFGRGQESLGAIKVYMEESNVDWVQAIKELAQRYRVAPEKIEPVSSERKFRAATEEEKDGTWLFDIRESWTDAEITNILSKNTLKHLGWYNKKEGAKQEAYSKIAAKLSYYNYYPLKSFSIVKNRKVTTFGAKSDYPIYLIDEGSHKKICQPKNPEKNYRFMYEPGAKPTDFIHGLKQLEREFNERKEAEDDDAMEREQMEAAGNDYLPKKKKSDPRLPEVILCAGGSDAINVACLGYQVLWLNSESAKLQEWQYISIAQKVMNFMQLMDIDATGLEEAHERCLQYLDILNIELPLSLLTHRDSRGYQCKDVRDYLNIHNYHDFKKLVSTALPYRFWDEKAKYNKSGEYVGKDYDFNNVHAYNFLQKNGFFRLAVGDKTDEFQYIHIKGNTVYQTNPVKIRGFIKHFLKERNADVSLRNAIFRTTQLSESSLTNLDEIDLDFKDYTPFSQFLFFRNETIEVTGSDVLEHKSKTLDRYIWEEDVYDHKFKKLDAPFTIEKDAAGGWDIKILDDKCMFLRYLIQTSRIHWRTELEVNLPASDMKPIDREKYLEENRFNIAGAMLSPEEQDEQKLHLMNKLYAMGYLLHRYKNRSKAWMVVAMDGKISNDGQSHGGSGKSLFLDLALRTMLKKNFMLNGRDPKIDQNPHKYDGLTEYHRYLFIEDANKYINLDVFYSDITGDIAVNPKGKKPYTIPFANAAKISLSTNYALKNIGPSTFRRLLYTVFSDYYHELAVGTDYKEKRDPEMEFGKKLFDDFNEAEWNRFYNTAVYALKFFLSTKEKIAPAMDNVNTRNLLEAIGPDVLEWANVYFNEESGNLDRYLVREEVFADFNFHSPKSKLTPHSWRDRINNFCRLRGYILNPPALLNKSGTIIKKVQPRTYNHHTNEWQVDPHGKPVAKEHFFVQTETTLMEEMNPPGTPNPAVNDPEEEDDDPF